MTFSFKKDAAHIYLEVSLLKLIVNVKSPDILEIS